MKKTCLLLVLVISTHANVSQAENNTVNTMLQVYASQDAAVEDAEQGRQLWQKTYQGDGEYSQRSCASCHTDDLTATGKHIKTGKLIKPMAPSANPDRLTDQKKIEKWFKRNCKWTMGRECSAQEKASFLLYINQ